MVIEAKWGENNSSRENPMLLSLKVNLKDE